MTLLFKHMSSFTRVA